MLRCARPSQDRLDIWEYIAADNPSATVHMKVITAQEYNNLTTQQKERISRTPLTPSDIKALIDTAVNLHSRALEHQKDKRWWTVLASAAGGLLGSITGALLK